MYLKEAVMFSKKEYFYDKIARLNYLIKYRRLKGSMFDPKYWFYIVSLKQLKMQKNIFV